MTANRNSLPPPLGPSGRTAPSAFLWPFRWVGGWAHSVLVLRPYGHSLLGPDRLPESATMRAPHNSPVRPPCAQSRPPFQRQPARSPISNNVLKTLPNFSIAQVGPLDRMSNQIFYTFSRPPPASNVHQKCWWAPPIPTTIFLFRIQSFVLSKADRGGARHVTTLNLVLQCSVSSPHTSGGGFWGSTLGCLAPPSLLPTCGAGHPFA